VPQRFTTLAEWLAWFETLHPKKIDMSLDRIRVILGGLGLVPPRYKVVTVGGTNGKGSCVAILESIYRQAGYRVGAFTSPHLVRFNERIRFDGADAHDEELIALFESIEASLGRVTLSYFEASAVAALLHFERRNADVAVLEVGMGGRLDAVNALDADAALIASIDLDHTAWLGPDREAIGLEKAGIMRAGRPAVVGDPDPPASLAAHAGEIGAGLELIGKDFAYRHDADGWRFEGRRA
jgi:dihydrofolate synthase / folylpolyglutamate synthase